MFLKLAKELSEVKLASKDVDVEWFSKIASNKYINEGKPLNETISKLAQDNGLNDEFVKRICETSNHQVSSHLFNTNQDKNFEFDLADWEKILPEQQYKFAEENPYSRSPKQYIEKQAELDTDRAHSYGNIGATLGGLYGLTGGLKGNPLSDPKAALMGGLVGSGLGYGLGRLTHRIANGPAIGKELNQKPKNLEVHPSHFSVDSNTGVFTEAPYFSPQEAQEIYNHPEVQSVYEKHKDWAHPEVDAAFFNQLGNKHPYYKQFAKTASSLNHIQLKSDPYESVMDLQESLLRAKEDVETKYEANEREQKLAYRKLYNEFKSEVKEASYFKVAQALVPFVKQETLEELTYDLLDDNVINDSDLFKIEKLAGSIDESALIIKIANYYDSLKDDYSQLSAARKEISEQVERVSDFLRNK